MKLFHLKLLPSCKNCRREKLSLSAFIIALFLATHSILASDAEKLKEKRIDAISDELRCLVCQNQSLSESEAPLALDLKKQVRDMVNRGLKDKVIKEYMVARYGDFILYDPPLKLKTFFLWFGPLMFLLLTAVIFRSAFNNRNQRITQKSFSNDEYAEARRKLKD